MRKFRGIHNLSIDSECSPATEGLTYPCGPKESLTSAVAVLKDRPITESPTGVENQLSQGKPAACRSTHRRILDGDWGARIGLLLSYLIVLFPRIAAAQENVIPKIAMCTPLAVPCGATTKVVLRGWTIGQYTTVKCDNDKVAIRVIKADAAPIPNKQDAKQIGDKQLELEITTAADLAPGSVMLTIESPDGTSKPHPLLVGGDLPVITETEPNDGFRQAQAIATSQIIDGQIQGDGNVDVFSIDLTEQTTLITEVQAAQFGSGLDSLLTLYNSAGSVISTSDDRDGTADSLMETTLAPGRYFIALQDAHDRGGPAHPYRLIVRPPGTPMTGK
jgi:Bacterial pre-peptidase C-terminal domain